MHTFPRPKLSNYRQIYYLSQLQRHQWFKGVDLRRSQNQRLRAIINHSYHNVPFYNNLFKSLGVKPKDIKTVKDLQKIPILTKENVIKNYPGEIIRKGVDIKQCHTRSTTGSTGIPLRISFGSKDYCYHIALHVFVLFAQGLKLNDKYVTIFHKGKHLFNNILFKKLGLLNWENISIFKPVEEIIEALQKSNPDVINSYPSILLLLSKEIEKRNISGINPRFIRHGGESLTESSRNRIGKNFKSELYAQYGTEEFGAIAFECKARSGYHIVSDAVVIEIIKDGETVAEGEEGEIVVTCLYNYTMPLIRYKLGDIGTFTSEKCACGRGFPLIKSIEGRSDDYLILPSGKKVSPRVINVLEDIPGVARYKTIQETKNKIVVNLIKGKGFSQKTIDQIKNHIKNGCNGEEIDIDVKLVKEIPQNRRGKARAVISYVKDDTYH